MNLLTRKKPPKPHYHSVYVTVGELREFIKDLDDGYHIHVGESNALSTCLQYDELTGLHVS